MRVVLLLALGCLTVGCAAKREVGLPVVYSSKLRFDPTPEKAPDPGAPPEETIELASYWQEVPDDFGTIEPTPRPKSIRKRLAARKAKREREAVERFVEPPPELAVPKRKARKEARPEGKKTGKSVEQLSRDHYLDYPTHIKAEKITFACPKSYTPRVRLTGEHVDRSRPERVRVQGGARLVIGELTLEAHRISWRVQPAGKEEIQILARGNVHLVSEVRGNVHRETAIRSLVITNDKLVPLR